MKRLLKKRDLGWFWRYETIALVTTLAVSGALIKPPILTTAGAPKLFSGAGRAQTKATASARTEHRREQERQVHPENYDLRTFPIADHEEHWRNLLWTTAVVQPQETFVATALDQILALMVQPELSDGQLRTIDAAARVGTQLFLSHPKRYAQLGQRFEQVLAQSSDAEWVAISLAALAKSDLSPERKRQLMAIVQRRFPAWAQNLSLNTTIRDITAMLEPPPPPPLADLLNWTIAPNQLHLYVLCQPDRQVLCRAVLKDAKGQFVRTKTGELWTVPLLLRSIHHLSWNFIRGQTPQGIYRIEGIVPQPDDEYFRAYGQFALVNLFLPFEPGVREFLPGQPGSFNGDLAAYQQRLPASWRQHWGIQQSFWAGKIGRSEFRIHGSGDAPDFFSGKDKNPASYNWNPSIGCLSALELYNEQGQLIAADMPKLLNVLETIGGENFSGYLIVVEVPHQSANQPIALEQIEAAIANKQPSNP
jgi:hypothetical protein